MSQHSSTFLTWASDSPAIGQKSEKVGHLRIQRNGAVDFGHVVGALDHWAHVFIVAVTFVEGEPLRY